MGFWICGQMSCAASREGRVGMKDALSARRGQAESAGAQGRGAEVSRAQPCSLPRVAAGPCASRLRAHLSPPGGGARGSRRGAHAPDHRPFSGGAGAPIPLRMGAIQDLSSNCGRGDSEFGAPASTGFLNARRSVPWLVSPPSPPGICGEAEARK